MPRLGAAHKGQAEVQHVAEDPGLGPEAEHVEAGFLHHVSHAPQRRAVAALHAAEQIVGVESHPLRAGDHRNRSGHTLIVALGDITDGYEAVLSVGAGAVEQFGESGTGGERCVARGVGLPKGPADDGGGYHGRTERPCAGPSGAVPLKMGRGSIEPVLGEFEESHGQIDGLVLDAVVQRPAEQSAGLRGVAHGQVRAGQCAACLRPQWGQLHGALAMFDRRIPVGQIHRRPREVVACEGVPRAACALGDRSMAAGRRPESGPGEGGGQHRLHAGHVDGLAGLRQCRQLPDGGHRGRPAGKGQRVLHARLRLARESPADQHAEGRILGAATAGAGDVRTEKQVVQCRRRRAAQCLCDRTGLSHAPGKERIAASLPSW